MAEGADPGRDVPAVAPLEVPEGRFEPTWDSLSTHTVPRWYRDGKFGIFVHWGPYCVPAFGNEWYPRNMYQRGSPEYEHHLQEYGPQSRFGYKDFIPRFEAQKFDPDEWAGLFRGSGASFVVPVAEHHDGFAMYDSRLSEWTAVKMGPRRDVVGELGRAVRAQWLTFGVSSHRAEHWWFFDGGNDFDSDVRDPRYAALYGPAQRRDTQPNQEFLDDWLARTCELVDLYRPGLVWFDWWIEQPAFEPYLRRFAAYYYNRGVQWGREVAINYKHRSFRDAAAVLDIERGQLEDIHPRFWQNDTSVSRTSWGYVERQEYKSAEAIIGDLVDVVSKNGALLLNVGPRPDGTIPEPERRILGEIGDWLATNGAAIYDTVPWKVYGEGPTVVAEGSFTDSRRAPFTSRDVRFTVGAETHGGVRREVLYATVLSKPRNGEVVVESLGTNLRLHPRPITSVRLLGAREPLKFTRGSHGLRVRLPQAVGCEGPPVLRIQAWRQTEGEGG